MYCLPEVLGFKEKLLYGAVGAAGWLGLTYIFYHDFLTGFISMLPFLYFFFRFIYLLKYRVATEVKVDDLLGGISG